MPASWEGINGVGELMLALDWVEVGVGVWVEVELEVVYCVTLEVEDGGWYVDVDFGVSVDLVDDEAAPSKTQEPLSTPKVCGPKKLKSSPEKSSPP